MAERPPENTIDALFRRGFVRLVVANLVGGVLILAYFQATGPPPTTRHESVWRDIGLFCFFAVVLTGLGWWVSVRTVRVLSAPGSLARVLRVPSMTAVGTFFLWVVVAMVSAALNYEAIGLCRSRCACSSASRSEVWRLRS
ncbi:MAG: hypothetical protein JWP02_2308 [Acidimicrobiales bacterium]|nr:hypothetical protein [Acidimicrobiales bacterium]